MKHDPFPCWAGPLKGGFHSLHTAPRFSCRANGWEHVSPLPGWFRSYEASEIRWTKHCRQILMFMELFRYLVPNFPWAQLFSYKHRLELRNGFSFPTPEGLRSLGHFDATFLEFRRKGRNSRQYV